MSARFYAPVVLLAVLACESYADAVSGSWTEPGSWPFIPIHAVNLPDGRVLTYGADGENQGGHVSYDVWDPAAGLGADAHLTLPNTTAVDTFCSAMVLMPQTGNVLTLSGDSKARNAIVRNQDVTAYDYRTDSVGRLDRGINRQRWYGTPVITGKGEIFLQAGTCWKESEEPCPVLLGTTPEIYRPDSGWNYLSNISGEVAEYAFGQSDGMKQWWYPRSWLMGNGEIYSLSGGRIQVTMSTEGDGSIVQHETLNDDNFGASNSGVMYQPDKLLITGGGGRDGNSDEWDGRTLATLIDLTTGVPVKTAAQPMNEGRQWHNSTVLPDGKVLVTGGSTRNNTLDLVTNNVEIWDPATDTWVTGAAGPIPRLYHSVALLLQDGRVFTGGGGATGPRVGTDGEVYSPPYLFKAGMQNRLSITAGPSVIDPGSSNTLTVSDASRVNRVTMIGYGAVTHSLNLGQRFIELDFTARANGRVEFITPSNINHMPPGYYMIFVLDAEGVPSVAHTVRVFPNDVAASPDQESQPLAPGVHHTSFEYNSLSDGGFRIISNYENWNSSQGIELWKNYNGYLAADGNSWIELDAKSGANTLIANYPTQADSNYTLSFSSSARPGFSAESNHFELYWNGQILDTISVDGNALTELNWQTYHYPVYATGDDTLTFREYDVDGGGAMLDNISLAPTPPTLSTSFENNTLPDGAVETLSSYENWSGTDGVELWKNHGGYTAAQGNTWIKLNAEGENTLKATYKSEPDWNYTLSFASAPHPGFSADNNSFDVYWNGRLLDTISVNGSGLTELNWQAYQYTVFATGTDTLTFQEHNTDGEGALLDNISITPMFMKTSFLVAQAATRAEKSNGGGAVDFGITIALLCLLGYRNRYELAVKVERK